MKAKIKSRSLLLVPETEKERKKLKEFIGGRALKLVAASDDRRVYYYMDNIWISIE